MAEFNTDGQNDTALYAKNMNRENMETLFLSPE